MGNFEKSIYGSISFTQIQCKILFLVHLNYFSICCLQCFLFFNWKYLLFNVSFSFLFWSDIEMIRVMRRRKKWFQPFPSLSFFFWPSHLTTSTSSNLFHFISVFRLLFFFWFLKGFSQVYENIRTVTFSLKNGCKNGLFSFNADIYCKFWLKYFVTSKFQEHTDHFF